VFVHTRFALDPKKVQEIRRAAALTEDVLRSTITNAVGKLPEPKPEPAPAPATPATVPAPATSAAPAPPAAAVPAEGKAETPEA